jgi:hypothetical protein
MPIDAALEYQYNNMARRPDAPELLQHLSELSEVYRGQADAKLDCVYGGGERERLDVFRCDLHPRRLLATRRQIDL